jgi:hypothetical protein
MGEQDLLLLVIKFLVKVLMQILLLRKLGKEGVNVFRIKININIVKISIILLGEKGKFLQMK